MKNLSLSNIIAATHGEYHGPTDILDRVVTAVTTDSRAVAADALFAAIPGEKVDGHDFMTVEEGNGPVNALDAALRKVLLPIYPQLENVRLVDYKVRILTPGDGTRAVTRVLIESAAGSEHWSTVGVSTNIIDASYRALHDSIVYRLYHDGARVPASV